MADNGNPIQVINSISDAASFALAQRMLDEVAHARRVNIMAEASLAKFLDSTGYGDSDAAKIVNQIKAGSDKHMTDLITSLQRNKIPVEPKVDLVNAIKDLQDAIKGLQKTSSTSINDL